MTTATDLFPSPAGDPAGTAPAAAQEHPALPVEAADDQAAVDGMAVDASGAVVPGADAPPPDLGPTDASSPDARQPDATAASTTDTPDATAGSAGSTSPVGSISPVGPVGPVGTARSAAPAGDCGPLLKKTFPALFAGGPKPLKLRIQVDIQERAPGVFSKQSLSAFFRRYTGSTSYLIAVSWAKTRFDLDGAPAGELSDEHRKIALDELARRRGNTESRAAIEEQQRRNRATLLHDFERTTLTLANFCALKGIAADEIEGYLATARREAAERPQNPRAFDDRPGGAGRGDRRPPGQRPAQPPVEPRRAEAGRPAPRRR